MQSPPPAALDGLPLSLARHATLIIACLNRSSSRLKTRARRSRRLQGPWPPSPRAYRWTAMRESCWSACAASQPPHRSGEERSRPVPPTRLLAPIARCAQLQLAMQGGDAAERRDSQLCACEQRRSWRQGRPRLLGSPRGGQPGGTGAAERPHGVGRGPWVSSSTRRHAVQPPTPPRMPGAPPLMWPPGAWPPTALRPPYPVLRCSALKAADLRQLAGEGAASFLGVPVLIDVPPTGHTPGPTVAALLLAYPSSAAASSE